MLTAIVGILLGNLLIATLFAPAIQNLREILNRFANIQLPARNTLPGAKQMTSEERNNAEETATREFNHLFREYVISFNAFKKVGSIFVSAITVLACVVAWQLSPSIGTRLLWITLFAGAVFGAGLFLQRAIAPSPSQLISIDFLQNNFANLHLSSLFDCSDLHINFGRMLGSRDPLAHFSIFQNLMFLGYKFLMTVSDQACSRLYFVAYGQMGGSVNFQQVWTPEVQTFSIPIGDFSLAEAIRHSESLHLNMWLFIPTPKSWVADKSLHPRILRDEVTERLGNQTGIRLYSNNCGWNSLDDNVDFERRSLLGFSFWKISRLIVPAADSPQAILRMFKSKVERCRSIQSQDYPSGIEVGNIR